MPRQQLAALVAFASSAYWVLVALQRASADAGASPAVPIALGVGFGLLGAVLWRARR